jgi:hypothetical protein
MHHTYCYNIVLHLADGSNVLFDSQTYNKRLSEYGIDEMLNNCMNECITKTYLQLHHAIVFTHHIIKIDIEYHEDAYY